MSDAAPAAAPRPPSPSVFLSYASEDRKAAQALRDALISYGLEVWYDESGLDGGDAWDQKIRRQIRECDFFMPLISAQTDARPEGYFRREWRLAVERTLDMADDHTFILPIVIDDTTQARARVPDKFLTVQWTRVPGGQPLPALEALCRRLLAGQGPAPPPRTTPDRPARVAAEPPRAFPAFPQAEPGHSVRFGFQVIGWALQCAWIGFQRLPRFIRWIVWLWLLAIVLAKACSSPNRHGERDEDRSAPAALPASGQLSPADAAKLREISEAYQGGSAKDYARLGTEIAQAFSSEIGKQVAAAENPLLAVPFSSPPGDAPARKLADATFAQIYGRVALSRHGHVGLLPDPPATSDPAAAVKAAREHEAKYVLVGTVEQGSAAQSLVVKLLKVADGSLLWSGAFPVAGADPAAIAAQVDARVPALDDDD